MGKISNWFNKVTKKVSETATSTAIEKVKTEGAKTVKDHAPEIIGTCAVIFALISIVKSPNPKTISDGASKFTYIHSITNNYHFHKH